MGSFRYFSRHRLEFVNTGSAPLFVRGRTGILSRERRVQMKNTKLSAKSPVFIGLLLIILGLVLFLLNFSVVPVIGVILGIPAVGVGIYFLVKGSRGEPGGSPSST
jgi:uncharacterized membrane protein HdeD (DUF308 family)